MLFSLILQQSPTSSIVAFAPYILIGLVFYFLLFMPMQRQKKKQQQMLSELKREMFLICKNCGRMLYTES